MCIRDSPLRTPCGPLASPLRAPCEPRGALGRTLQRIVLPEVAKHGFMRSRWDQAFLILSQVHYVPGALAGWRD
eukprot:6778523-Alexandrium_andersonii.AAC.1